MSERTALPGSGVARLAGILALILSIAASAAGRAQAPQQADGSGDARPIVVAGAIEGAIGPAAAAYVETVLETAAERDADAVLLRLNTPGGLATSMRDIIVAILGSDVPVIGYVAPAGAHAASAGTYILYATSLAAMAPGTNLGAATPVQIGGGMPGLPQPDDGEGPRDDTDESGKDAPDSAPEPTPPAGMKAKAVNDAVAFIRSLAELHGRNADWAERAVREAASLSARVAREEGVVEIVAADLDTLLSAADGRRVTTASGDTTLATRDARVETIEPGAVNRLLGLLTNPNVALILMMIGVYGLIFELANPGTIGPGIVGVICLILGLYALNQLPISYAGLALVGLGITLMVAEAVTPTLGVLGVGGLAAFVIGATMLIDVDAPGFRLSWSVIAGLAIANGAVLVLLLGYVWRALRRPVVSGPAEMAGMPARVLDWSADSGHVLTRGERWRARGPGGLAPGDRVQIAAVDGLTLKVARPSDAADSAPSPPEGATR